MNPWELILYVLGWLALLIVVFIALAVIWGVIKWVIQTIQARKTREQLKLTDEDIIDIAGVRAVGLYRNTDHYPTSRTAFIEGVKFALTYRKDSNHADRI